MNHKSLLVGISLLSLVACTAGSAEDAESSEAADTSSLCGNGTRDVGEQCDDGNKSNLDGCSATCQVEHTHRLDKMEMMFGTDAFCAKNALGGAIKGVAQGQLQDALKNAVSDGTINLFLSFAGLTDLTGQSASSMTLGSYIGKPVAALGLDAVFTANSDALTPELLPKVTFPGSVAAGGALSAGPGNFAFAITMGGGPAKVSLSSAKAKATVGAASTPTGYTASANLDPAIKSFATTTGGQICGNISANSLAAIPVPTELTTGSYKCTQGYTTNNSMLDVLVGGCKVLFVTALGATQPDEVDPTAATPGAGGSYTLQAGSDKKVSGCKDKTGASVPVAACLEAAAFSAGFKFTSTRAVVRGLTP
jgi:cysteine-rich repeat protein